MNTPKPETSHVKGMSVGRAIVVGQLCVNSGVVLVIAATTLICRTRHLLTLGESLMLGAVLGWPWWSLSVPVWRRWALSRGVDAKQLQKAGVRSLLLWPKGSIFEKTEIRHRKR